MDKVVDPVSTKEFTIAADSPKTEQGTATYYFENAANKAAFDKEPAKYIKVKLP
jgi:YHS domain-containing protein